MLKHHSALHKQVNTKTSVYYVFITWKSVSQIKVKSKSQFIAKYNYKDFALLSP